MIYNKVPNCFVLNKLTLQTEVRQTGEHDI